MPEVERRRRGTAVGQRVELGSLRRLLRDGAAVSRSARARRPCLRGTARTGRRGIVEGDVDATARGHDQRLARERGRAVLVGAVDRDHPERRAGDREALRRVVRVHEPERARTSPPRTRARADVRRSRRGSGSRRTCGRRGPGRDRREVAARGSTTKAPKSPRRTSFEETWWLWYQNVPTWSDAEAVRVALARGGPRSASRPRRRPRRSARRRRASGSSRRPSTSSFTSSTSTRSPSRTRSSGPGDLPSKVSASTVRPDARWIVAVPRRQREAVVGRAVAGRADRRRWCLRRSVRAVVARVPRRDGAAAVVGVAVATSRCTCPGGGCPTTPSRRRTPPGARGRRPRTPRPSRDAPAASRHGRTHERTRSRLALARR